MSVIYETGEVVVVIEKWKNLDALKNHLGTPPHVGLQRTGKRDR